MLPIKLKICGFCSYLDETEIDFTRFGEKGLYLIAGDTGAGKTTIFDAITYALYGQASGDMRKPRLFRSQNASPDVPTYVELTFMSGGKKYKIRRNPEYMRRAKRGTGLTKQLPEAVLTVYDGDKPQEFVLTGLQRAGTKRTGSETDIESIIGIDAKKFKQLSMIAQGAFMKVLNADTETKNIILRSIFNTDNYKKIEQALKELAEKYERDHSMLNDEFVRRLSAAYCAEGSEFSNELQEVKSRNERYITNAGDCVAVLERIIDEDEKRIEEIKKLLSGNEAVLSDKNERIGTLNEREKRRIQYLDLCAELEKNEARLPLLEKEFEAVGDNESKASVLDSEYTRLEASLEDHKKRELLKKELSDSENALKLAQDGVIRKTSRIKELAGSIESFRREYDSLKECAADLERLKAEISGKQKTINEYRKLLSFIKSYEKSIADHERKKAVYIRNSEKSERLNAEYDRLNKAFLDDQAGILAQELTEGRPCPVCGSITHPHKAVKMHNAPNEQEVRLARKNAEDAARDASGSSADCAAAKASAMQLRESIISSGKELFENAGSISELKAVVTEAGINLKKEIENDNIRMDKINSMISRRDELNRAVPELERQHEENRSELDSLNRSIAGYNQKIEGISAQINELEVKLAFGTMRETTERMKCLADESRKLKDNYKKAESSLKECRTMIAQQRAMTESFGEVNKESAADELTELKKEVSEIKKLNSSQSDELSEIRTRKSCNDGAKNFFLANSERLDELMRLVSETADLRDTANAKLREGRSRLTLETYAQAAYFDRVLYFANERLVKMSSGKYEFRRSEVPMDNANKTGLDINVFDYESGTERSVITLSGGESFMASLSLALGFSDVIQSEAGGIRLDTMFIDEGFGTLDERVLENAYAVFSDLSNDSRCLVGIISHVDELKSRIHNRISVSKDVEGNSHAIVETDN